MTIYKKVEALLASDLTSYKIGNENGLSAQYVDNYRTGKSKLENMQLGKALQLASYYNKVKGEITMENKTFERIAERFFHTAKESDTSFVGYYNDGMALVVNPQKNMYDEFMEEYATKSVKDIYEAFTDNGMEFDEDELAELKETAQAEYEVLQEFKKALLEEAE